MMLRINHYKLIKSTPKPGDIIYVPSYKADETKQKSLENCDREGGAAKIKRITEDHLGFHYVTVEEFSGYFEMNWEKELKHRQEELANKYGYNHAYIKPLK